MSRSVQRFVGMAKDLKESVMMETQYQVMAVTKIVMSKQHGPASVVQQHQETSVLRQFRLQKQSLLL